MTRPAPGLEGTDALPCSFLAIQLPLSDLCCLVLLGDLLWLPPELTGVEGMRLPCPYFACNSLQTLQEDDSDCDLRFIAQHNML